MEIAHKAFAEHAAPLSARPEPGFTLRVCPEADALRKAQAVVRQIIADGLPAGGVRVLLDEGEYELTESLRFDARDSGTPSSPIVWRAAPGASVCLSGGHRLMPGDFAPVAPDDALYARLPDPAHTLVCDLPSLGLSIEPLRGGFGEAYAGKAKIAQYNRNGNAWPELFWRDAPLHLARYPAQGHLRTLRSEPIRDLRTPQRIRFGYDDPFIDSLEEPERAFLHGYFRFDWANAMVAVGRVDRASKTIETADALHFGVIDDMRYCFLNVPEALRMAGQYHIDDIAGRLYLMPPEGFSLSPVYVSSVKDELLAFSGASHIHVCGIRLSYARGSGVTVEGGDGIRVEGCSLCNLGYGGVRIGCQQSPLIHRADRVGNGGVNHAVQSCDIWNTGFGGVYVCAGNRETLQGCGIRVDNCDIHDFGRIGKCYYMAAYLTGVGIAVSNNRFHAGVHSAIWFDGNDNIIEYNEFYDLLRESDDAAAVYCGCDYTLGGNVVRYNFFHHMQSNARTDSGVFGTFCDDNAASVAYYGNLYYHMQGAHHSHGGHDIVFENNLIVEKCDNTRYSVTLCRYHHPETFAANGAHRVAYRLAPAESRLWRDRFPHLREYPTWDDDEQVCPHYASYRNNAIIRHAPMTIDFPWHVPKYKNVIENNLFTNDDAGFRNEANLDLRLSEDSIVYRRLPAFLPIPFERMGLYLDEYRCVP